MGERESAKARARGLWTVAEDTHARRSGSTVTTWRVTDPFGVLVVSCSDRAQAEQHADDDAADRGAPIAAAISAAVAEAVAAERETCATMVAAREAEFAAAATQMVGSVVRETRVAYETTSEELGRLVARIRARATTPASGATPVHPASREACEVAAAERARGRDVYADGEGRVVEAPVQDAERAVIEARKGGA